MDLAKALSSSPLPRLLHSDVAAFLSVVDSADSAVVTVETVELSSAAAAVVVVAVEEEKIAALHRLAPEAAQASAADSVAVLTAGLVCEAWGYLAAAGAEAEKHRPSED